ncbi:MAG: sigma-70 family RNA polymerase sigma factor [Myxococcales bacterium]|nr:sigma-70 family RNA polymerase sigma factor [Myxococcales bacterium]
MKKSNQTLSLAEEHRLIEAARDGDQQAVNTLIEAHYPAMYHLALKYTRDPERALDATQESCLQVLRHLGQFRAESRFSSWMARIVINSARLRYRGERRLVPMAEVQVPDRPAPGPDSERRVADRQLLTIVDQCLREGREGDYQLFMRRFVDGESVSTISEELGISVPAIKTRVHRARQRLKLESDALGLGMAPAPA